MTVINGNLNYYNTSVCGNYWTDTTGTVTAVRYGTSVYLICELDFDNDFNSIQPINIRLLPTWAYPAVDVMITTVVLKGVDIVTPVRLIASTDGFLKMLSYGTIPAHPYIIYHTIHYHVA